MPAEAAHDQDIDFAEPESYNVEIDFAGHVDQALSRDSCHADMTRSFEIPGLLHVIHNATCDLPKAMLCYHEQQNNQTNFHLLEI